jgi:hypothetical protein
MIVLLLTASLLSQRSVTLESRVVRIPALVQELAAKSGEPLASAANLRNEVLYVNLAERPLSEVMNLVAEAAGCEWVRRENRVELTRTNQKLREDEVTERQYDLGKIRKRLELMKSPTTVIDNSNAPELISKMKAVFSGADRTVSDPYEFTEGLRPVRRLLQRVLASQAPSWIVSSPYGRIATYADRPTRLQKALGVPMQSLMSRFVDEDKAMRRALDLNGENSASFKGDALGYLNEDAEQEMNGPLRPIVTINRQRDHVEVALRIFSESGGEVTSAQSVLMLTPDATDTNTLQEVLPRGVNLKAEPIVHALLKARLNQREDKTVLELLRDPEKWEPLKITLEKPLSDLLGQARKDAVFSLPDQLATNLLSSINGVGSDDLVKHLHTSMTFDVRGNLLVGRPRRPYLSWLSRADRSAMRQLISRCGNGSPIPLDTLSDYTAKQPELVGIDYFESTWICRAVHGLRMSEDTNALTLSYGYRDSLRLWASLSKAQKDAMRMGKDVAFSALSTIGRVALTSMTYDRGISFEPTAKQSKRMPMSLMLPNGIPQNAVLQPEPASTPCVIAETKNGAVAFSAISSAAYFQAQQERGGYSDGGFPLMIGAKLRPLLTNVLQVKVRLAAGVTAVIYWRDYEFNGTVPAVEWQELMGPAGVLYRQELEKYRKAFSGGETTAAASENEVVPNLWAPSHAGSSQELGKAIGRLKHVWATPLAPFSASPRLANRMVAALVS